MADMRENLLHSLSRAIKRGEPITLSNYVPTPPANSHEALIDATIKDILRSVQHHQTPAFSGDSGDEDLVETE